MAYRISELPVPSSNPFQNDALERRPLVEFLAALIERTGGPFVLALDSPWGSGKTTLVRMLEAVLKTQNYSCIYFNAWKVDYVTDPLVALVSSINDLDIGTGQAAASFKQHLKSARKVAGLVAKRAGVAAAKALTAGVLDLEAEIEATASDLVGDSIKDIVDAYQKEGELIEKFRDELEKAVKQLASAGKKPTLVFFIDELDRCRPTFSVELLERIKHLFDVANILFVLSMDKSQLEASVAAVYGVRINAPEYLRRFIDLDYAIPTVKANRFVENLFARYDLNAVFAKRNHRKSQYDRSNFIDIFSTLADITSLSFRTQERCMTRLQVVMDQTPDDHYLEPVIVALLIVIRAVNPALFSRLSTGYASVTDVMDYLGSLPGGLDFINDRSGSFIEATLILSDRNERRKEDLLADLRNKAAQANTPYGERSTDVLKWCDELGRSVRGPAWISRIIGKIDLASGIRE